ncbi:MAG TPA: hypothetical protein VFZ91_11680 [Allosphingosinicella sp.]
MRRWLNPGKRPDPQPFPRLPAEPIDEGGAACRNSDIVSGYRFCATLQLRTPLRVLSRHGELHPGVDRQPPPVTEEGWEGIWVPELRTWRELGIDAREMPPGTMASDIGQIPVDGGEYLKFLVAIRTAAEGDESVTGRRTAVVQVLEETRWDDFARAHGGREAVLNKLFPPFLTTVPRMAARTAAAFARMGYGSPASLSRETDGTLLAVEGVGPAMVKAIRSACELAAEPDSEYVDRVGR